MEKAKDFYSKSVADAIRQACSEFATSQEKLDIEVVEPGSAGIFGLCRKRAHIRVTRKNSSDQEKNSRKGKPVPAGQQHAKKTESDRDIAQKEAQPEPVRKEKPKGKEPQPENRESQPAPQALETEPVAPPSEEILSEVKSDLDRILELMGFPSETTITVDGTAISCQIDGEFEDSIVGRDGRTLDSLQYLLRKISSTQLSDRMMIDLNAGNFRERRSEELRKLAADLAEKVKENGKTQAIPALNPSERRVVHVMLQDDKTVRSRSVGDGLFKKVLIYKPGSKGKKAGGKRRVRQSGGTAEK